MRIACTVTQRSVTVTRNPSLSWPLVAAGLEGRGRNRRIRHPRASRKSSMSSASARQAAGLSTRYLSVCPVRGCLSGSSGLAGTGARLGGPGPGEARRCALRTVRIVHCSVHVAHCAHCVMCVLRVARCALCLLRALRVARWALCLLRTLGVAGCACCALCDEHSTPKLNCALAMRAARNKRAHSTQ